MEGDLMQLTCKTSGSKPAADIRWFKNDKEIKGKNEERPSNQNEYAEISIKGQIQGILRLLSQIIRFMIKCNLNQICPFFLN